MYVRDLRGGILSAVKFQHLLELTGLHKVLIPSNAPNKGDTGMLIVRSILAASYPSALSLSLWDCSVRYTVS